MPADSLIVLGGKPKVGKSWLVIQLIQATAAGAPFLGMPTTQGPVLYFCLEDGKPRLQDRLIKQRAQRGLPVYPVFELAPMNEGGLDQLRSLIRQHRPVLTVIDTLAAAKSGKVDENDAGKMGDIGKALHRMAQDEQTTIVIVHHHRKGALGDDPINDLRGSSAIGGDADIALGLYRDANGGPYCSLAGVGKDIDHVELRLEFDRVQTWAWQVMGDARKLAHDEAVQDVLDALAKLDGTVSLAAITDAVGKSRQAVGKTLKVMKARGLVVERKETGRGGARLVYALPSSATVG